MANSVDVYLDNIIKNNKLSHAYLFVGQSKEVTDVIIKFVKALFCENNFSKSYDFCNKCRHCKQIDSNTYIDFYKISAESSIKKDDIIELKNDMSLKSSFGKKIYWIEEVDKMTNQAANSILKFLEEPEDDIIAILSSKSLNTVLPTIVSRCQVVNIKSDYKKVNQIENFEEINKVTRNFYREYSSNKNIAVLNVIEGINSKEELIYFYDLLIENIDVNNIVNRLNLLEIILLAKEEISKNVNWTLVMEASLFEMIKKGIYFNDGN